MGSRVALLALVIAGPALAQGTAPAAAPQEPTTIEARTIEGVGDIEVTARGEADIRRGDLSIFGDLLRYNREFGRVRAEGGVRMEIGADRFFGPWLTYDLIDDTGVFQSPRFTLGTETPAHGAADSLEFVGEQHYLLQNATYTTCKPGHDDWVLKARELDLDYSTEEGHAKSPRLVFFDVPIFGAPAASFPLESRRRSGLLMPYYSQTSQRGLEFGIPYYWNIAPEYDATFTPVYMSKRGEQLKNEFRYLGSSYAGDLRLEYLPHDPIAERPRTGLTLQHHEVFAPNLTGTIDFNRVSDDRYFVDLASQVRQVSIGNLQQEGVLNYSGKFDERYTYTALARVQTFQTLQDPLAPITPPYRRVPQLAFGTAANDIAGRFDASLPTEFVRFTHPTLVEGDRFSLNPVISMPHLAPGWFFTPKIGMRHANYSLGTEAGGPGASPSVNIPWMSADAGLVFERETRFFGDTLTQTFEPRLFYVYAPFRNQDAIPLFDTTLADFNFAQLFSENRFSGGDRFGDANEVTLAFTSRFLQSNGQEVFRATLGQRYYLSEERVGLTPTTPPIDSSESDLLGSVGGRFFSHWTFDATAQYNRVAQRFEQFGVSMRYNPEVAKVLNASYRFTRGTLRQIDLSGQWPFAAGWYAVGRYNYSFFDKRLLEGLAGVEYNAGCWVFRGVVQRIQAATQVASTGIFFQLEFNGIGQVGTQNAAALLSRSIPGYSVTNPVNSSLAPPSARPQLPFEQVF